MFVFLHRAGEGRGESCQQPSAINRKPCCGWFMMAPAFVACSNMARLKSPYILIFRLLCVVPFTPSSFTASFSDPHILFQSPLPSMSLSPLPFPFFCRVWVFFVFFFPRVNDILSWLYHQLKQAKMCGSLSVWGFYPHTKRKWVHEMTNTQPDYSFYHTRVNRNTIASAGQLKSDASIGYI